ALPPEKHKTMVEAVSAIDAALAEKDPESPPLMSFVRQIKALEVEAEVAEPAPEEAAAGKEPSAAAQGASSTTPSASPARPVQAASGGSAPVFTAGAPNDIRTLDDIVKALEPALSHIGHVTRAFMDIDRFHPLMIDLGRFAARASLLAPP